MDDQGLFICYEPKKFTVEHQDVLNKASAILEDYRKQGFSLTLRQLYYQFVAKGWLPNRQAEYNRLGNIISAGRMAGVISWDAIEDRGRNLMGINHYDSVPDFFNAVKGRFALDLWANQDWRPEVWIEKQALEGVIGGICNQLRVPFFSTKGYNSQSEQWRAGRRFASYVHKGQRPIVFHLGDHDPSGIDMTRDNRDRLSTFAGVPVTVVRIAMNRDQIERFDCPENPVKFTDSRAEAYVAEHGYHSWELDALSPKFIAELIEQNVSQIRDPERWDEMVEAETEDRMVMDEMIRQYFGEKE